MEASLRGGAGRAARALLDAGADWSLADRDGFTPLHAAAYGGRAAAVAALVGAGAPVDGAAADGNTPLHRACWGETRGHAEAARALLERGADGARAAPGGLTPLELALASENDATRGVLERWLAARGGARDAGALSFEGVPELGDARPHAEAAPE